MELGHPKSSVHTITTRWTLQSTESGEKPPLPDPMKLAKDIRDQLKSAEFSIALKSDVSQTMKQVEILLACYKETGPYLRRALVQLRQIVKSKVKNNDAAVSQELSNFKNRLERVVAKKHQIVELRDHKAEEPNANVKIFQVFIEDNIRVVIESKVVDITEKMTSAKKLKRLVNEIERLLGTSSFSKKVRLNVRDTLQVIHNMLALDGILAMKLKAECVSLKHSVSKGKTAEEEIEKRLKGMKMKLNRVTKECEMRRDESEKAMRELSKTMLDMDKEINEINKQREKARQLDISHRNPSEFWVPPPVPEPRLSSSFFEQIQNEDQRYREPIFTLKPLKEVDSES